MLGTTLLNIYCHVKAYVNKHLTEVLIIICT